MSSLLICDKFLQSFLSVLIFVFLVTPLYLFRIVVFLLPKPAEVFQYFDPGSACFIGWTYDRIPSGSISILCRFSERNEPTSFQQTFSKLVEKFPEFRCYPSTFRGFPCWKWENFRIENHIFFHDLESKEEMYSLKGSLNRSPFQEKKSPWAVHLVNISENHYSSYLIFRLQHSLADGHRLWEFFGTGNSRVTKPATTLQKLCAFFEAVLDTYPALSKPGIQTENVPKFFSVTSTDAVPVSLIKGIKTKAKTNFQAVTLACLRASLRSHFERRGKPIPPNLDFMTPGPSFSNKRSNSSSANDFSFISFSLPVGSGTEAESLLQILRSTDALLKGRGKEGLKNYIACNVLLGSLPSCFQQRLARTGWSSFSDYPGPSQKFVLEGRVCEDVDFFVQFVEKPHCMTVGCLSYDGLWKISLMIGQGFCRDQEEAQKLADSVIENIIALKENVEDNCDADVLLNDKFIV